MNAWSLVHHTFRIGLHIGFRLLSGIRVEGRGHVPASGGLLIVSNHASFLDPCVVGSSLHRLCHYLARDSLFENRWFGGLIRGLGSIPVARGTSDRRAISACVEVLRRGETIVLFPEGTRGDGTTVADFQRGFLLMVRQARVPVLPVHVDGTARMLPRGAVWPRPARLRVRFGPAIPAGDVLAIGASGVRDRVVALAPAPA